MWYLILILIIVAGLISYRVVTYPTCDSLLRIWENYGYLINLYRGLIDKSIVVGIIWLESRGNPNARQYHEAGQTWAIGLMQVTQRACEYWGFNPERLNEAWYNIMVGCHILNQLYLRAITDGEADKYYWVGAYSEGYTNRYSANSIKYRDRILAIADKFNRCIGG